MDLTKRSNQEAQTNNNGHKLIELCQAADLKTVNGSIGDDKDVGALTCHKGNGSTIDYFLISEVLMAFVHNFIDVQDKHLSDVHCPIIANIKSANVYHRKDVHILQNQTNDEQAGLLNTTSFT